MDTLADIPAFLLSLLQRHGATLIALLITGVVASTVYFFFRVVRLARSKGYYLIKIEDGAIAPSSISAYVTLLAAVLGGLWLAFSVGVSGNLELQRLSLELARTKYLPIMDIELAVESFGRSTSGDQDRRAVRFAATVKNRGPKAAKISLSLVPLLNVLRVDKTGQGDIASLPYQKIECLPGAHVTCSLTTWKVAVLEPDGTAYYSFLHPELEPGIYFAQFQLPIDPAEVRPVGDFLATKPVLWSRSVYFEVKAASLPASASAGI